jgi:hypothetical protein
MIHSCQIIYYFLEHTYFYFDSLISLLGYCDLIFLLHFCQCDALINITVLIAYKLSIFSEYGELFWSVFRARLQKQLLRFHLSLSPFNLSSRQNSRGSAFFRVRYPSTTAVTALTLNHRQDPGRSRARYHNIWANCVHCSLEQQTL